MATATDPPTAGQLAELLTAARAIAEQAGQAILSCAAEARAGAEHKTDGSPVTRADRGAHEVICAGLSALQTGLPIVSEEGRGDAGRLAGAAAWWLVDPLDGTKEFIRGLDEYTVNIALIAGGAPVLGVVHVPPAGTTYSAARGCGAWRSDGGSPPAAVRPRRPVRPASAMVSRSHLDERTKALLAHLGIDEVVPSGSSLKICAVAEGRADLYPRLGPTCHWDTAAGTAVARAAGCAVVDLAGADLSYALSADLKHGGFLVAPETARTAVEEACRWLAESRPATAERSGQKVSGHDA